MLILSGGQHALANERKYRSIKSTFEGSNPGTTMADMPGRCEGIVRDILKAYLGEMAGGQTVEQINGVLDLQIVRDLGGSNRAESQGE